MARLASQGGRGGIPSLCPANYSHTNQSVRNMEVGGEHFPLSVLHLSAVWNECLGGSTRWPSVLPGWLRSCGELAIPKLGRKSKKIHQGYFLYLFFFFAFYTHMIRYKCTLHDTEFTLDMLHKRHGWTVGSVSSDSSFNPHRTCSGTTLHFIFIN